MHFEQVLLNAVPISLGVAITVVLALATLYHRSLRYTLLGVAIALSAGFGVGLFSTVDGGYAVIRPAAAVLVTALAIAAPAAAWGPWSRSPWLIAFTAWAVISLIWTSDLHASATSLIGIVAALALGGILGALNVRRAARIVIVALGLSVAMSLVCIWIIPSVGTALSVRPGVGTTVVRFGAFSWNSDFGKAAGLLAVLSLAQLPGASRNRSLYLALSVAAFAVVVYTSSVTALVATVAGIAVLLVSQVRRGLNTTIWFGLMLTAFVLLLGDTLSSGPITTALGRSSDLTGRGPVWSYVLEEIHQRPWLGHGVGVGPSIVQRFGWAAEGNGNAHDGYLQLGFALGWIGLALFALVLVAAAARASKEPIFISLLTFYVLANIANNYTVSPDLLVGVLGWVLAAGGVARTAPTSGNSRFASPPSSLPVPEGSGCRPPGILAASTRGEE